MDGPVLNGRTLRTRHQGACSSTALGTLILLIPKKGHAWTTGAGAVILQKTPITATVETLSPQLRIPATPG